MKNEFLQLLINPDTKSNFKEINQDYIFFEDNTKFNTINETPILFYKDSLFSCSEILNKISTTQDRSQLDTSVIKNYVRRKILPSLCHDFDYEKRYKSLNDKLKENSLILVLGSGEKVNLYKSLFHKHNVITSDVHNSFNPDIIFDGHSIPFKSNIFDLVIAAQVIEHTLMPWKFCKECQRVTKIDGLLQIEAPQNYPYHGAPYDFFRFTYTGFISLFRECDVVNSVITEGSASMVAVSISDFLINLYSNKYYRRIMLFFTRFLLGWLKYIDKYNNRINRRNISSPKGYAFTFKKSNVKKNINSILEEYYKLSN